MRLRSHTPNGPQRISISLNGVLLESVEVPVEWSEFTIDIPPESIRSALNLLAFGFEKQSRPSDGGVSKDDRLLAAEMSSLEVLDADERTVVSFDPVYGRFDLGRGFYQPESDVVEAQSSHGRTLPIWRLLGDAGHPVGVVGFWNTWPAYPVNGFLVTSRMGLRGRRQNTTTALTWPLELASELEPLYPSASDMKDTFARIHALDCDPPLTELRNGLADVLRQDELYFRASKKLLPTLERGFFTVYFESIDVASHSYIQWRSGSRLPETCRETARGLVDAVYVEVDRYIGELLEMLPETATVIIVSDHGLAPAGDRGLHSPNGIFIAAGEGIRKSADYPRRLAPGHRAHDPPSTVRARAARDGRESSRSDLRGRLAPYKSCPIRQTESIEGQVGTGVSREATEDVLERLKALGYIE